MLRVSKALSCLLIVGWLATAANGAWDLTTWRPWPFNKDEKPGKPEKIIAVWTDTVATTANQPPLRGFGGRLMFYDGKKEAAIKVEGTLVVYAFDETGRDANTARPDRKYVFTPEQLPAHYSKSKAGHSYSVWLPWDEVGGVQAEITLIVRFEPKAGGPVISEPCREILPGMPPQGAAGGVLSATSVRLASATAPVNPAGWSNPAAPNGAASVAGVGGVQPLTYETPVAQGNATEQRDESGRPRRMTTATIAMPADMAARQFAMEPAVPPAQAWQPPARNWQPPAPWTEPPRGANGQPPVSPTPPQTSTPVSMPPQAGFAPGRSRPLGEPLVRPNHDRALWQQRPGGSPSVPGSQPGPECSNAGPASSPAALTPTN